MKLSLTALVAKWRSETYTEGYNATRALEKCADELEAVLAAEQTEAHDLRHDYPALTQQAQPETPTLQQIAEEVSWPKQPPSPASVRKAERIMALFAPKDPQFPLHCNLCGGAYGHADPCGA